MPIDPSTGQPGVRVLAVSQTLVAKCPKKAWKEACQSEPTTPVASRFEQCALPQAAISIPTLIKEYAGPVSTT